MSVIESIRNFFITKSKRELLIYYGVFLGVLVLITGIIIYNHFSSMSELQGKLRTINSLRSKSVTLLQKNKEILAQQEAVQEILAQDPNFLIMRYFNEQLIPALTLPSGAITAGPTRVEGETSKGYTEQKLTVSFSHLNMKQLTELLFKIEQNPRVYTKELKITKDLKDNLLNVTLIIATLEPQQTPA